MGFHATWVGRLTCSIVFKIQEGDKTPFQVSFRWSEDFEKVSISVCTSGRLPMRSNEPRKLLLYQLGLAGSSKLTAVPSSFKELLGLIRWDAMGCDGNVVDIDV